MSTPLSDQQSCVCGRVLLRRLALSDLAAFQGYRNDSEVGRYQGWSPMSDTEAAEFLAAMNAVAIFQPGKWCQLGIADATTGVLIGDVGVHISPDESEAEIGFSLSRKSQGVGLATEAVRGTIRLIFQHTPADRVHATTDARNVRCIALLQRIGMRQVDTLSTLFRGEPCVEYVFEVCRHLEG